MKVIYAFTVILGACLLFLVQPLIAKLILPWFGGTSAVWSAALMFFQVCVFGGDHIYKMDVNQMMNFHLERDADLTIATIPVPLSEAHQFGVVEIDEDFRVTGFVEKPKDGAKT